MAWTETTHANYRRSGEGYASNLTDAEWELMAPLLPPPARCGRRPATSRWAVLDALLYMVWTGCPWRGLPRDFPPRSAVIVDHALHHRQPCRRRIRFSPGGPRRSGGARPRAAAHLGGPDPRLVLLQHRNDATPDEFIGERYAIEPYRLTLNPLRELPGLNF
ncbi:transposase [Ancylobacter dichloromethanicus]|uniref:transposase n=1 Tax=Ancylobacter dichloromethanicus TaxID=518825 RepID=UPI00360625DA